MPQPRDVDQAPSRPWAFAILAVLALAVVIVYLPAMPGPLILDDITIARQSRPPVSWGPVAAVLAQERWLGQFSLLIDLWSWDHWPAGFRLTNLAIHLSIAGVVMALALHLLASPAVSMVSPHRRVAVAGSIAAIWALHPMAVSAVSYVIQRHESLTALCFASVLLGVAMARQAGRRPWIGWVLASFAMALGLGAKQIILLAPLVALLMDRTFFSRKTRDLVQGGTAGHVLLWAIAMIHVPRLLRETGVLATGTTTPGVLPAPTAGSPVQAGFASAHLDPLVYLFSQPSVLLHYLRGALWPSGLLLDYDLQIWETHRLWPTLAPALVYPLSLVLVVALGVVGLWLLLRRCSPAGWLIVAAFLFLAPTSSLLPIADPVFDHRFYLPLAVVCAGVILGGAALLDAMERGGVLQPGQASKLGIVVVLLTATLLGVQTWRRNREMSSDLVLWGRMIQMDPQHGRAWSHLAAGLLRDGDVEAARTAAVEACRLEPLVPEGFVTRGLALAALDQSERAAPMLGHALWLRPLDWRTHLALGRVLEGLGRDVEAEQHYRVAMQQGHLHAEPVAQMGHLLLRRGPLAEARQLAQQAVELDPQSPAGWRLLGAVEQQAGSLKPAVVAYTRSLTLGSPSAQVLINRGNCLRQLGEMEMALADYGRAVELAPGDAGARQNLGGLLLMLGRPREAVEQLSAALEVDAGMIQALFNRAVAWHQLGQHDRAMADLRRFVAAGGRPDPAFVQALQQALTATPRGTAPETPSPGGP